jgi:hypothetical protein
MAGLASVVCRSLLQLPTGRKALKRLGLSVENAEGRPDAYIRIPENKEAVFRPVVRHEGMPVADIVQVWLDVSNHPARGKEQAEQIWKRVLATSIRKEHR